MKRLICALFAILMMSVLFAGCTVETTVNPQYVDPIAENYASATEVDDDGNITYEFEEEQYDEFLTDLHEVVKEESREYVDSPKQYTHYNLKDSDDEENYGIVVGITKETYEEFGEEDLKEEAKRVGESAVKFQMNTEDPAKELPVSYRDSSTGEVFFTITVTAE
ncbi:MAG: hypothetical protein Q4A12_06645 [Eubacteriales bacterium]|nr:hypothetical protein [Eubacteriales bacterium]